MGARGIVEPRIEVYLADVADRLIGPRRARAAIVDELRDGLHSLVDADLGRGLAPEAAVGAALAEFGSPHTLAQVFAGELANSQARRTGLAYLFTGPLVGVSWLLLLAPSGWWLPGPGALWRSIPALPMVALGCGAGLLVVAGTGRLSRLLRVHPRHMLDITVVLGLACIAADLIMLGILAHAAVPTFESAAALAALAATASLTRLACSVAAVERCRRARCALTP